ncbi:Calcipressin-like protein [Sphaceloma murrayae]|uniref:Calcipressin-like protein n=1 Tax=Sphaceloma murrayae TaxID=2082308 RepID=A0A2K1QPB6_9PEZI|nr:Calcipressin-like protein [Sphaceloma murrayae]
MAAIHTPSLPSPTSGMKRRHSPSLSLDLSDLPPLTTPSQPSNTLIITNLLDPQIFAGSKLQAIRDAISAQAPLHSFSPLKSFRRIIATFYSIDDATHVRQLLDGENVMSHRIRVYFGEPTELEEKDQTLHLPEAGKLFFISPPPSPPVGWEMRTEEPPNKDVHADDLVSALHKLNAAKSHVEYPPSPTSMRSGSVGGSGGRSRSSTIVFDPVDHGSSPHLPAIAVEDTSEEEEEVVKGREIQSPVALGETKAFVHTARPPVELMEQ